MFAQAFAMYADPSYCGILRTAAPKTYEFVKGAIEYAKANPGEYQVIKQINAREIRTRQKNGGRPPSRSEGIGSAPATRVAQDAEVKFSEASTAASNIIEAFKTNSGDGWAKLKPHLLSLQQMVDRTYQSL